MKVPVDVPLMLNVIIVFSPTCRGGPAKLKQGKTPPLGVLACQLQRSATLVTRRQLRVHKKLCADVIGNDFDLTKNKFSYTSLKELETKVPEFFRNLCRTLRFSSRVERHQPVAAL